MLKKYSANLVVIGGVFLALVLINQLDSLRPTVHYDPFSEKKLIELPLRNPGQLNTSELKQANVAWRYFVNNTYAKTGLVNSADRFPATTLWDTGSYVFALLAVVDFKIISRNEFKNRTTQLLETLKILPMGINGLPNKSYNVRNLKTIGYSKPDWKRVVGWSVVDIGRMMIAMKALTLKFPEYTKQVNEIISLWNVGYLTQDGEIIGSVADKKKIQIHQEGRIGYEQYAAKGLMLFAVPAYASTSYRRHLSFTQVNNIDVPIDKRTSDTHEYESYTVAEPFFLDVLETGGDAMSLTMLYRLYQAMETRYKDTGIVTAVSEDHIDRWPWFIYSSVVREGEPWRVASVYGKIHDDLRIFSSKTAFALWSIFEGDYSDVMHEKALPLVRPKKGFLSGSYETRRGDVSAVPLNTNAVILESLYFKKNGPYINSITVMKSHLKPKRTERY